MEEIPKTMKAVVIEGNEAAVKKNIPVPKLDDDFMLIKVLAVAGNPSEWKHIDMKLGPQGSILGCDAIGKVVKLGPKVTDFAIGEIVTAFVHGASHKRPYNGAFGQFIEVDQATTYKVDQNIKYADSDNLSAGPCTTFEGTVALPVSLTTAGVIMHHHMGLKLQWQPEKAQNEFPILIWGGATGVGQALIQLCKLFHGYTKIITVASSKHEKLLKTMGADEVYDYHDPAVIETIKSKYPNVQHLIDTVSTDQTIQQVYKCSDDTNPVTLMQLLFLNEDSIKPEDRKSNVNIIGTLIYKVSGLDVPIGDFFFPADQKYREDTAAFVKFVSPYVAQGKIYHMPVKIYRNGLDDIPMITDLIRKGQAAGVKLVTVLPESE